MRYWVLALALVIPASADIRFRARPMTHDVPLGRGQCDIRLEVDGQVEVSVRANEVSVHSVTGQDARDDGSECNFPLPDRDPREFKFQSVRGGKAAQLSQPPTTRNHFTALVTIRDSSGGFGRYHFRLTWELAPGEERTSSNPLARINAMSLRGRGNGETRVNGEDPHRLADATVDIDVGGHIVVSFKEPGRPRPIVFSGSVTSREGSRIRADVATEDGRLRGPMWLTVGEKDDVTNVTLDATDGRDRLHLTWDHR